MARALSKQCSSNVSRSYCWRGKRPAAESGLYPLSLSSKPTLPPLALMMLEWGPGQPPCPHPLWLSLPLGGWKMGGGEKGPPVCFPRGSASLQRQLGPHSGPVTCRSPERPDGSADLASPARFCPSHTWADFGHLLGVPLTPPSPDTHLARSSSPQPGSARTPVYWCCPLPPAASSPPTCSGPSLLHSTSLVRLWVRPRWRGTPPPGRDLSLFCSRMYPQHPDAVWHLWALR